MKKLKLIFLALSGFFVFSFCLIGFAHTRYGRPMLPVIYSLLGKPKSCPLGFDRAPTPALQRNFAKTYAQAHAAAPVATEKPVPDFEFGVTTEPQLAAFAEEHSGSCHLIRSSGETECLNLKTKRGSQTLWANFNEGGKLAHLKSIETVQEAKQASEQYDELNKMLAFKVGHATASSGSYSAKDLKSGLLYQAAREYFYKNYFSTLRITNMGSNFAITTEFNDVESFN